MRKEYGRKGGHLQRTSQSDRAFFVSNQNVEGIYLGGLAMNFLGDMERGVVTERVSPNKTRRKQIQTRVSFDTSGWKPPQRWIATKSSENPPRNPYPKRVWGRRALIQTLIEAAQSASGGCATRTQLFCGPDLKSLVRTARARKDFRRARRPSFDWPGRHSPHR